MEGTEKDGRGGVGKHQLIPEKEFEAEVEDVGRTDTTLLSRLRETEVCLADERSINEALRLEIIRLKSSGQLGGNVFVAGEVSVPTPMPGEDAGENRSLQGESVGESQDMGIRWSRSSERHQEINPPDQLGESVNIILTAERERKKNDDGLGGSGSVVRPWKKVLYERQPFPDNYVPDSFLEKLVTNAYVRHPDLRLYVANTFAVTQQISAVTLFLFVFLHTADGLISVERMIVVDLLLLFGGYATVFLVSPKGTVVSPKGGNGEAKDLGGDLSSHNCLQEEYMAGGGGHTSDSRLSPLSSPTVARMGNDAIWASTDGRGPQGRQGNQGLDHLSVSSTLWSFLLFLAILRVMAPVLRTLTVSYSDDTIYALAVTLCVLHLAFHDYSYANTASNHFQGTLSLNAAIFAAVLLASRLESNELVFGLVLFALEVFAFFPLARREVKRYSLLLHVALTAAMVIASGLLLFLQHRTLFFAYSCTVVFVTIGCPLWLMGVQQYKLRIEGPWDIAHVETNG